jgi:hypothetical protein
LRTSQGELSVWHTETSIGVEPRGLGGRQVEALVVKLLEHRFPSGDTQDPNG